MMIAHNAYEKITDTLLWINYDWVLKFTVELNSYKNDKKENYHKEYAYNKKNQYSVSINRIFNYYISLESTKKDSNGMKYQVRIGVKEFYFFKYALKDALKWFIGDSSVFIRNDNIVTVQPVSPIRVNVAFGAYLEFEPAVLNNDDSYIIGLRCYVNSDVLGFFIDVNTLFVLNDFMNSFNMYQSAQLLLNYLGRPESGTNLVDMASNISSNEGFFNRVKKGNGLIGTQ